MFEASCVRLTSARDQIVVLNVYRSGSEKLSAQFYDELTAVDVLSSFDMVQHVCGATHRCGNTLDLVMTSPTVNWTPLPSTLLASSQTTRSSSAV